MNFYDKACVEYDYLYRNGLHKQAEKQSLFILQVLYPIKEGLRGDYDDEIYRIIWFWIALSDPREFEGKTSLLKHLDSALPYRERWWEDLKREYQSSSFKIPVEFWSEINSKINETSQALKGFLYNAL